MESKKAHTSLIQYRTRAHSPLRNTSHKAGVVGNLDPVTVFAMQHMAAERCAAAAFDGRHDL